MLEMKTQLKVRKKRKEARETFVGMQEGNSKFSSPHKILLNIELCLETIDIRIILSYSLNRQPAYY